MRQLPYRARVKGYENCRTREVRRNSRDRTKLTSLTATFPPFSFSAVLLPFFFALAACLALRFFLLIMSTLI